MTNGKNYNSILLLTVYLGLVLVGGNAQVFAHSASNSLFDLRNEIEFKEDFDNKPDEEKIAFDASLERYFEDVEVFLKELQKLKADKKFNLNSDKFDVSEQRNVACKVDGCPRARSTTTFVDLDSSLLNSAVGRASSVFEEWIILSDCLENQESENLFSKTSKLKLSYNLNELKIEISAPKLTKQKADILAARFSQAYNVYSKRDAKLVVKTIYDNTSFKSENNKIFVVTRLPRAAIDSLLK